MGWNDLESTWGNAVATLGPGGQRYGSDLPAWRGGTLGAGRVGVGGVAGVAGAPAAGSTPAGDPKLAQNLQGAQQNYLKQTKERYEKMMQLAQQFGQSQLMNNQVQLRQQQAAGQQSLVNRGLGNSTVVDAVNQNAQDQSLRRQADIGERQAQLQLNVLGDTTIAPPDLAMYAQLFSAPRTGGAPLIPSLNNFDLFSGPKGNKRR
jgi:hypothetical protein